MSPRESSDGMTEAARSGSGGVGASPATSTNSEAPTVDRERDISDWKIRSERSRTTPCRCAIFVESRRCDVGVRVRYAPDGSGCDLGIEEVRPDDSSAGYGNASVPSDRLPAPS